MNIDGESAAAQSTHRGKTYDFCSDECKERRKEP